MQKFIFYHLAVCVTIAISMSCTREQRSVQGEKTGTSEERVVEPVSPLHELPEQSATDVQNREAELRKRAAGLRKGISKNDVVKILGKPQYESKTKLVFSPNLKRSWHIIGDKFQVLFLEFDNEEKLIEWVWSTPSVN